VFTVFRFQTAAFVSIGRGKPVMQHKKIEGPPKRADRKVITAMIGGLTGLVLLLIGFVFFSDFPDGSHKATQNPAPPPEDVSRARP
jgi:hypothetical protein